MSTTVSQNKWDGGIAEDLRTFATDECEKSLNFDVFTNPHRLIPYGDSIADTVNSTGDRTIANTQISDVDMSIAGSSYMIAGVGYEGVSGSQKAQFYLKNGVSGIVDVWEQQAISLRANFIKGTGVVYKDKFYALVNSTVSTEGIILYRNDGGSVTNVGSLTGTYVTLPGKVARPFVHPEENVMYFVINTTICRWDGTTFSTNVDLIPVGYGVSSMTDYGTYLAFAMKPLRGNGNSVVALWDRNMTNTTFQGSLEFGEGNMLILENLDNNLFAIMQSQSESSIANFTVIQNKITIKRYAGGTIDTIKSISISSSLALASILKLKNGGKLYFGFPADDCVYAFGKNKNGNYILTKDRYYSNGTTIGSAFLGLSIIGDIMWRGFLNASNVYTLMRSKIVAALGESITYNATSVYKTSINPSMPINDRYRRKQLEAVEISYVGKASGLIGLKYGFDGGAMTSIISESTTAASATKEATNEADGTVFGEGTDLQFQIESTGGVEIIELKYRYRVLNSTI